MVFGVFLDYLPNNDIKCRPYLNMANSKIQLQYRWYIEHATPGPSSIYCNLRCQAAFCTRKHPARKITNVCEVHRPAIKTRISSFAILGTISPYSHPHNPTWTEDQTGLVTNPPQTIFILKRSRQVSGQITSRDVHCRGAMPLRS